MANEIPIPEGVKLVRVYGISDSGAPTEWFSSKQERDAEALRRFKIFVQEKKAALLAQASQGMYQDGTSTIDETIAEGEARKWAGNRVQGRYVDTAMPPPDDTGVVPELHKMMNEQTAAMRNAS